MEKHFRASLTTKYPFKEDTRLIVVIPCYNEPDVLNTLQSLFRCDKGSFGIEIILLINSYAFNKNEIKEANRLTYHQCSDFAFHNNNEQIKLIPVLVEDLPGHQSGAGLPRKIGMDEATYRLHQTGCDSGIIVCLDADCTVEKNYFTEIHHQFKKYELHSATIEFHHPVEYLREDDPLREASIIYETYLRYYRRALEYCGYPYAYFTIGSAIAVTSETYARAGGMCKLQAGEDFYFMQKVFPLGKTKFIDTTKVYPASRLSDRVPFGTGPELIKMMENGTIVKKTYCFESFKMLKQLFDQIELFYTASAEETSKIIDDLPKPVREFLNEEDFTGRMTEISENTSNTLSFRKRFFNYFNAFKILKYLNFVHPYYLELSDVRQEVLKIESGERKIDTI